MLKKPKKNPTFNEYFPIDYEATYFMFDYVFADTALKNKIIEQLF